jgi:serine/threonine protein kinase
MLGLKEVNAEPIPGYRLIERLGSGGFGEVWKCEVPGGLFKAIKFVFGDLNALDGDALRAEGELQSVHRVKSIRHPFLLSMDRVEAIDGELVIVMELADQNLYERFEQYRDAGKPGIPRNELLCYLREAAEVLDLMNRRHQLQHLDIKPHNLFLVSNHVKVGDFGLVSSLAGIKEGGDPVQVSAITPLYSSPELFLGRPSRFSDQYSLAIVYQELLTGRLPFQGKNGRQLLFQHTKEAPDLTSLPAMDRKTVARALAKEPDKRYTSCMEFVRSLIANGAYMSGVAKKAASAAKAASATMADQNLFDTVKPPEAPVAPPTPTDFRDKLSAVLTEIMTSLGASAPSEAAGPPTLATDDNLLRYKFRVGVPLAVARDRLDAFCAQSFGRLVREDDRGRGFTVPLPNKSQWSERQIALEVQVILDCVEMGAPTPIEVAAQVRALGCAPDQCMRLLQEMGLPLLDSLRANLLVNAEAPAQERLRWNQSLKVRPMYPNGTVGKAIPCRARDISLSGIGFYLPCALDAIEVLIELPNAVHAPVLAVPATVVRAGRRPDGKYEAGALFRLPVQRDA